jgi:DHA3 family macrolide efflux protein-like MFS transporter
MNAKRDIALVVAARFISHAGGTAVFFVGLWGTAAYAFKVDASALAVLMAGNGIAGIVGSVVAGVLVDRLGPRAVLIGAELLTAAVATALFFSQGYAVFVGLAWLFALCASPTFTAGAAYGPSLATDADALKRVNAQIEAAGTAGFVLGPALGAFAAWKWGTHSVFVLAVVASIAAAGIMWGARAGRRHAEDEERQHPMRELSDGLRLVYTTRGLRYPILVGTVVWFGFGAFSALEPLFFRDAVGVGVEWIGWMNTAFSLGLVAGAAALAKMPTRVISQRNLTILGALCGLGALGYVGTTKLPIIVVGAVVWGFVIGMTEPMLRTLLQLVAPQRFVGRVVGAAQYHRNAGELVPLAIAPAAAVLFGVQATLIAGGLIVALVLASLLGRATAIDRELAEQGVYAAPGAVAEGPAHVGLGDEIL